MQLFFKKSLTYLNVAILIFSLLGLLSAGKKVNAQSTQMDTPFGGFELFFLPCTCTAETRWNVIVPFYTEQGNMGMGFLLSDYAPLRYANYYHSPGSWLLGYYSTNSDSECEIGVDPYCYPLPYYGTITTNTGSSIP